MTPRTSSLFALALALSGALHAGCGIKSKTTASPLRQTATAMEELAELMTSVVDPESALEAVPEMKTQFQAVIDGVNALLAGAGPQQSSGLGAMAGAIAAMKDLERSQLILNREFKRLDALKGLPAEFWDVVRVESIRMVAAMAPASAGNPMAASVTQLAGMYDQHGPRKVVEVKLHNFTYDPDSPAYAQLAAFAGPDAQVVAFGNPDDIRETYVNIAPVEDFDAFVAKIDVGKVTDSEQACCEVVVEMPDVVEEPPAAEPAVHESAEAAEEVVEVDPAVAEAERKAREEAEAAAARERAEAAERARIESLLARPHLAKPADHVKLAAFLSDRQHEFHQRAVDALLVLPPKNVTDQKVRADIARGFRALTTAGDASGDKPVRGLVIWAGKFSTPVLIELLKSAQTGSKTAVLEGLGAYPTAEGAAAVCEELVAGAEREPAVKALARMGPLAEDPVLAKLPSDNAEVNVAAINVLAAAGTNQSVSMLRRASKSENEKVKQAALDAIRKIREREQKMKAETAAATATAK